MLRVPPGRGGRLWLLRRLDVASRGASVLERKVQALREEERRQMLRSERSGAEWHRACVEAETWQLRTTLAGGQQAVRLAALDESATVEIDWVATMGVHYPERARCVIPDSRSAVLSGTAPVFAAAAYRAAVQAAAEHAAAQAALRTVRTELELTGQRVRALQRRWIPLLRETLRGVELQLAERERAESVQRRWATAGPGAGQ